MPLSFGDCLFDAGTRQLFRAGREVPLSPKALALLELLLSQRPRAVSKQQISEHLWPKTFVSESNLTSLMTELRTALGDEAGAPRYVRTHHRFGYAFCGQCEAPADGADTHYRLFLDDRQVTLREGENVLGRAEEAAVFLDSDTVSRRHARIGIVGSTATVEDLGSKNGTILRGQPLRRPEPLKDGDELQLGAVRMTFRVLQGRETKTHG
jgi:DNA-binding winged helix-turn-helix (wHTH) protein